MEDLTPRPGHVVAVTTLPLCALCGELATWDVRTRFGGSWANACGVCVNDLAAQPGVTGVGIGQRLVLVGDVPRPLTVGAVLAHKRDLRFMIHVDRAPGVRLVTDHGSLRPPRVRDWEAFREVLRQREADIARSVRRHVGTPRLEDGAGEHDVAWIEAVDPTLAELEGENGVGLEQVIAAEAWLDRQAR